MSQTNTLQGPVVRVAPRPNIYTVLIWVAIVVLLIAMVTCLYYLMAAPPRGYGLNFGDMFGKNILPTAAPVGK
jgi:flagellar basal body-associated protein FliL